MLSEIPFVNFRNSKILTINLGVDDEPDFDFNNVNTTIDLYGFILSLIVALVLGLLTTVHFKRFPKNSLLEECNGNFITVYRFDCLYNNYNC